MDDRLERMEMPGRQARVISTEGVLGKAILSEYEWHYDEPPEKGGNATAPAPVDHLLGSLSACFAVTLRTESAKHDFDFHALDITAAAQPETGFIETIDLTANIETDHDDDRIETVISHSERQCNILQLIREDIPVSLEWRRADLNEVREQFLE